MLRRLWMSSQFAWPNKAMTSSKVLATFSSDSFMEEISFHALICKFDQWDRCFLNNVLEALELQVLTPDLILDQTSGLTLVSVTFSQFPGLLQFESFSFNFSSDNFVRIILLTIFASFGPTSPEDASSRSYSAAMDPKKSVSTVSSDFSLSFLVLLSSEKTNL